MKYHIVAIDTVLKQQIYNLGNEEALYQKYLYKIDLIRLSSIL